MAFEGLSEKLNNVFKKLKSRGKLTESDVKEAMREVKLALLEADVSYKVVKDFVAKVSERAVGEEVLASLTAGHQDRKRGALRSHGQQQCPDKFRIKAAYSHHDVRTPGFR